MRSEIRLPRRLWMHVAARGLDDRLAAGEDPSADPALAGRARYLLSRRPRRTIVRGLERVLSERTRRSSFSAAISCDPAAVAVARPALEQLARALRSREELAPRGVAITHILLTEPLSALYRPAYRDELYEAARDALFALGPDHAAGEAATPEERSRALPVVAEIPERSSFLR
jgi:NAD(P)-dependent dehydrogenase (short-subunit alcohol dehydrogenase family)